MMIDDQTFFAWLDGELAAGEAAKVEALVASDPALARRAREHRAMAAGLRGAFDSVSVTPVPEAIRRLVEPEGAEIVELSSWRKRVARPFSGPKSQWAAMAATLVLGLVVGTTLDVAGGGGPVEVRDGQLYAAAAVDRALEGQLASAGSDGGIRIGLTYRDRSGAICRIFETDSAGGLACREGDDWRLRGLFDAPKSAGAEYRMAAGADPRLLEMVDASIAGEPFDAAQEQAARRQGWR